MTETQDLLYRWLMIVGAMPLRRIAPDGQDVGAAFSNQILQGFREQQQLHQIALLLNDREGILLPGLAPFFRTAALKDGVVQMLRLTARLYGAHEFWFASEVWRSALAAQPGASTEPKDAADRTEAVMIWYEGPAGRRATRYGIVREAGCVRLEPAQELGDVGGRFCGIVVAQQPDRRGLS